MKILIRDLMHECSNVPDEIKSPALADESIENPIEDIVLPDDWEVINCVGIGYTDATEITLTFRDETETVQRIITISSEQPYQNGLYLIDPIYRIEFYESEYTPDLTISHNGTYIGRVGFGEYRQLNTSIPKEPGFFGTYESRMTLSGQVIPGAGGYSGRTQDVDVRYKIERETYDDMEKAIDYINKDYPYFILFDCEMHKLPLTMYRFYAKTKNPITKLQSSTYEFKYSYKFNFIECF